MITVIATDLGDRRLTNTVTARFNFRRGYMLDVTAAVAAATATSHCHFNYSSLVALVVCLLSRTLIARRSAAGC